MYSLSFHSLPCTISNFRLRPPSPQCNKNDTYSVFTIHQKKTKNKNASPLTPIVLLIKPEKTACAINISKP